MPQPIVKPWKETKKNSNLSCFLWIELFRNKADHGVKLSYYTCNSQCQERYVLKIGLVYKYFFNFENIELAVTALKCQLETKIILYLMRVAQYQKCNIELTPYDTCHYSTFLIYLLESGGLKWNF